MSQAVTVACVCDSAYAPHAAVLLQTLAASRGEERVEVHLLAGEGLDEATAARLAAYAAELGLGWQRHQLPADIGFPQVGRYAQAVWSRLYLPQLLPQLDRILYLDVDILVLQSLAPLLATDLGTAWMGVVAHTGAGVAAQLGHLPELAQQPYFNSGVLLMDLRRLREVDLLGRARACAQAQAAHLVWPDQDVLNLVCAGQVRYLHPRWNALADLWLEPPPRQPVAGYTPEQLDSARASPAVVHFDGSVDVKPWHYRSLHPYRGLYRRARELTPWPLQRLEGASLKNAVLRRLPRHWQYQLVRWKKTLRSLIGSPA
ncbi:MAG TPA: glycosyltransferase [Solimonas sp.]|nr:glycosyltransferase [Solimonas sp.]